MTTITITLNKERAFNLIAYTLMGCALLVVLTQSMLVALLTGLVTFVLIDQTALLLERRVKKGWEKFAALALLSTIVTITLAVSVWSMVSFFQSDAGSVQALLQKLADIIESSRGQLPLWVSQHLPNGVDELNAAIVNTLREHASKASTLGAHAEHITMQVVFGVIIGALIAQTHTRTKVKTRNKPFVAAMSERIARFENAFRIILSAQVKISAIYTLAVGIFVFMILPFFGISLPFKATIVLVTFFGGLLPVVGGAVANILIVIMALSHSLTAAIVTEIFMLTLNKVEFFLSARFIGDALAAKPWEPLVAMMFFYALFGLPGMVAAPFFYAYIKYELMKNGVV